MIYNYNTPVSPIFLSINFWMGCNKVSDGCKFCYMHRMQDEKGSNPNEVWRTSYRTFFAAVDWDAKENFYL